MYAPLTSVVLLYELSPHIYKDLQMYVILPSAQGCNWATLFLGDINTRTWPSRLGESQMRQ
jgi:hypothetical protein